MSTLPPGYRTTEAAGLVILWREEPDGTSRCVTVAAATCTPVPLAEIAARDANHHPPACKDPDYARR